jgi:hypothetical protein
MIPKSCRLFGQDHAQNQKLSSSRKVADFSDKVMLGTKESRVPNRRKADAGPADANPDGPLANEPGPPYLRAT